MRPGKTERVTTGGYFEKEAGNERVLQKTETISIAFTSKNVLHFIGEIQRG